MKAVNRYHIQWAIGLLLVLSFVGGAMYGDVVLLIALAQIAYVIELHTSATDSTQLREGSPQEQLRVAVDNCLNMGISSGELATILREQYQARHGKKLHPLAME